MRELTGKSVKKWLKALAQIFDKNKDYLTQLDKAIGDADHGVNMSRGFTAVAEKLEESETEDIGELLKITAMTLISKVGGASGPLYGSFFLRAATPAKGHASIGPKKIGELLQTGLKGVVDRGKVEPGDKTMVDAMYPAVNVFKEIDAETLEAAFKKVAEAARKGAESTIGMYAKKGRASYLGERSEGHKDPGAESTALMFEALYKAVKPN